MLGVDGGDGILAVHDGGDRRLQQHVRNAGPVIPPDRVAAVYRDLDMQRVMAEQHGLGRRRVAPVAGEEAGFGEPGRATGTVRRKGAVLDAVGGDVGVRAGGERRRFVQEGAGPGDDLFSAHRVVAAGPGCAAVLRDRVRAVERVVEAAPARIGGIERITGVRHRNDKLRTGNGRDLLVDMRGLDAEIRPFRRQIADLGEEGPVGVRVDRLAAPGLVPGVDFRLQFLPAREEVAVGRRKLVQQGVEIRPESAACQVEAGQNLVLDKGVQLGGDLASPDSHSFDHGILGSGMKGLPVYQDRLPAAIASARRDANRNASGAATSGTRVSRWKVLRYPIMLDWK